MTAPWAETTLPTILSSYHLKDIFNMDKFGLFYQCLPDRSYHLKGEKCSGGKHSKTRLTGLAAGNPFGERLPMSVIWKLKIPRCFKGAKHLPCRYRNQAKSWMSSELFEEWVRELDRKFGVEKRKITMIINNCKAHLHVENLGWVELIFLPPNTTSVTQPMDQGIIRLLKAKYRSLAMKKVISALEEKKALPKFSVLSAMFMLRKAWDAIPNSTFNNCFRKAGISQTTVESALCEDDNPFAGLEAVEDVLEMLQGDLHRLKATFGGADISLDEYVDIHSDVSTNGAVLNEQDILAEVVGCIAESDGNEDESSDEPVAKPPISEVHKAIEILEKFTLFSRSGEDLMSSLKVVNCIIHAEEQLSKKQSTINAYFRKEK